jgi:hypothetical protein
MNGPSTEKIQQARQGSQILTLSPINPAPGNAIPERPETYRLPSKGGDRYFGLTRSWYYQAEKEGILRLIRIRARGKIRGVTLVPYDDVAALVNAAKTKSSSSGDNQQGGNG